jgi:hypothetical protein
MPQKGSIAQPCRAAACTHTMLPGTGSYRHNRISPSNMRTACVKMCTQSLDTPPLETQQPTAVLQKATVASTPQKGVVHATYEHSQTVQE